jgi:hypothetical protein
VTALPKTAKFNWDNGTLEDILVETRYFLFDPLVILERSSKPSPVSPKEHKATLRPVDRSTLSSPPKKEDILIHAFPDTFDCNLLRMVADRFLSCECFARSFFGSAR